MRNFTFLIFVVIAFCCWGTYGPTLHIGQAAMGTEGKLSSLRPFMCVGIAYFLIAVIFPVLMLVFAGEKGNWSVAGFGWSFIAGAVGALGALGITMAFKFQGKPVYVMPLVFGCAPIVNTLVTMAMTKTFRQANILFFIGILIVAIGAAGVLTFKPTSPKKASSDSAVVSARTLVSYWPQEAAVGSTERSGPGPSETATASSTLPEKSNAAPVVPGANSPRTSPSENKTSLVTTASNTMLVALSVFVTAVCWGAYGPVLHRGQAKMNGSRLRPFLCVGLAYFAIAVVAPYFLLPYFPESGEWLTPTGWISAGVWWSMAAGAVGAIGALGIIYAFNFGGKPIFVMPLVFGFAPVVNTLVETTSKGLLSEVQPLFYGSLALVITGAVMVLVFAPKSAPPKAVTH